MLLYRHPRIEVIVAGGAVRRADGAVIGSTATQPDRPVQGRLRHHRRVGDRRGGRAAATSTIARCRRRRRSSPTRAASCWSRTRQNSGAARRSASPISARSRPLSPIARAAGGLASICHHRRHRGGRGDGQARGRYRRCPAPRRRRSRCAARKPARARGNQTEAAYSKAIPVMPRSALLRASSKHTAATSSGAAHPSARFWPRA